MKAITPFISIVLLIAFTVAVGAVISVWFTTITTTQTSTVQSSSDALAKCASTSLTISEVRFAAAGTPKRVNVTLSSAGNENLKNVTVTVVGGGAVTTTQRFFNATGDDLTPGVLFATSVDATNVTLPPEQVSANAFCQNQYAITATCKSGEPCMIPV